MCGEYNRKISACMNVCECSGKVSACTNKYFHECVAKYPRKVCDCQCMCVQTDAFFRTHFFNETELPGILFTGQCFFFTNQITSNQR